MDVKNLAIMGANRNVRVASPKTSIVGDYDHLEHVVMQRESHLIERGHVVIQRWNRKHI